MHTCSLLLAVSLLAGQTADPTYLPETVDGGTVAPAGPAYLPPPGPPAPPAEVPVSLPPQAAPPVPPDGPVPPTPMNFLQTGYPTNLPNTAPVPPPSPPDSWVPPQVSAPPTDFTPPPQPTPGWPLPVLPPNQATTGPPSRGLTAEEILPPAQGANSALYNGSADGTLPLHTQGGEAPTPLVAPFPPGDDGRYKAVWGVVDLKIFPDALRVAPNGLPYHPIGTVDLDFNLWLWRQQRIYLFGINRFWGKEDDNQPLINGPKASGKNPVQGIFNISKREYDIILGGAWNYLGPLELRLWAYGYNNLNRGYDLSSPYGFNDGVAIENRWYLSNMYALLGQQGYNVSRATFLSLGYYPSKVLTDLEGHFFSPGAFARAYLIYEIPSTLWYLYADGQLICRNGFQPKLLETDFGLAIVPCSSNPLFEIRLGSEAVADYQAGVVRSNWLPYVQFRLNF